MLLLLVSFKVVWSHPLVAVLALREKFFLMSRGLMSGQVLLGAEGTGTSFFCASISLGVEAPMLTGEIQK